MTGLRWVAEMIGAAVMVTSGIAATAFGVACVVEVSVDRVVRAWNLFDQFVEFAVTIRRDKRRAKAERASRK